MGLFDRAKKLATPQNIERAKRMLTDENVDKAASGIKRVAPRAGRVVDGVAGRAKALNHGGGTRGTPGRTTGPGTTAPGAEPGAAGPGSAGPGADRQRHDGPGRTHG